MDDRLKAVSLKALWIEVLFQCSTMLIEKEATPSTPELVMLLLGMVGCTEEQEC